jgi:hypothetical protein
MSEVTYVRGNGSFGPEDIAQLVAGLELALTNLGIKDRNDPGDLTRQANHSTCHRR